MPAPACGPTAGPDGAPSTPTRGRPACCCRSRCFSARPCSSASSSTGTRAERGADLSNTDHIAGIALRFLIVAALTSLGVALCLAIASLSYRDLNEFQRQPLRLASEWVFAAGICFPFVVVGGLLFGVPVHILLRRREIAGLWPYALAGVVVGALA